MQATEQRIAEFVHGCYQPQGDRFQLLQYLIAIDHEFGYIPPQAIDQLQADLGVSRAEINGLISFYAVLGSQPAAAYRVLISDNITDRFHGNNALLQKSSNWPSSCLSVWG